MTEDLRSLDREVGQALGFEPSVYWMASNDGGESMCANTSNSGPWFTERDLREWLAERQQRGAKYFATMEILQRERWPAFSTSWEAASQVVEKMAQMGFTMDLQYKGKGRNYEFTAECSFDRWRNIRDFGHAVGSVPESIARLRHFVLCSSRFRTVASRARPVCWRNLTLLAARSTNGVALTLYCLTR